MQLVADLIVGHCNNINVNVLVNELSPDSEKVPEKVEEIKGIESEVCKVATVEQEEKVKKEVDKAIERPKKIEEELKKVRAKIAALRKKKEGQRRGTTDLLLFTSFPLSLMSQYSLLYFHEITSTIMNCSKITFL